VHVRTEWTILQPEEVSSLVAPERRGGPRTTRLPSGSGGPATTQLPSGSGGPATTQLPSGRSHTTIVAEPRRAGSDR